MSDAPEKGVCDYAKRYRVVTHTSGNELQGPAITFGCYDSDRDARQALTDAGFTNGQWGWRNEYGYSTAHITPVLEYTGYRRADLPPTPEDLVEVLTALLDFAERHSHRWDGENGSHPQTIVERGTCTLAQTKRKFGLK